MCAGAAKNSFDCDSDPDSDADFLIGTCLVRWADYKTGAIVCQGQCRPTMWAGIAGQYINGGIKNITARRAV
jgi:hypothetical protein